MSIRSCSALATPSCSVRRTTWTPVGDEPNRYGGDDRRATRLSQADHRCGSPQRNHTMRWREHAGHRPNHRTEGVVTGDRRAWTLPSRAPLPEHASSPHRRCMISPVSIAASNTYI
jgi:hypothetical protein